MLPRTSSRFFLPSLVSSHVVTVKLWQRNEASIYLAFYNSYEIRTKKKGQFVETDFIEKPSETSLGKDHDQENSHQVHRRYKGRVTLLTNNALIRNVSTLLISPRIQNHTNYDVKQQNTKTYDMQYIILRILHRYDKS